MIEHKMILLVVALAVVLISTTAHVGFGRVFAHPKIDAPANPQRLGNSIRPLKSLREFMIRLRAHGEKVERTGRVSQPFFSVKGRVITVGGQQVQVFAYSTAQTAERESKRVGGQGSSAGTIMPMWVATPHFYKSGKLIVLYVGEDASTVKALETALGPQFAGR